MVFEGGPPEKNGHKRGGQAKTFWLFEEGSRKKIVYAAPFCYQINQNGATKKYFSCKISVEQLALRARKSQLHSKLLHSSHATMPDTTS